MQKNYKDVISNFNDSHNIKDVIETITGGIIKNKSLCCPLHNGDNKAGASIHTGKNIFTCWTGDCGRAITPWYFIQKYYGLNSFKEVAQKANDLFNAGIPIYEKKEVAEEEDKQQVEYDAVYNVSKYLSEAKEILKEELSKNKHILLNANTGLGKTFGIVDLVKDNIFVDDYIFFLVPTRSIAEQVAKEYPVFKLFYDNDTKLPQSNFIVSTYHKIERLEDALRLETETRAKLGEFPPMYTVILDECHELMSKRTLLGGKARKIEDLIRNSDRSILMSANTDYFNKAYKESEIFNKYISIATGEIEYNSDLLNIHRLPKKEDKKTQNIIKIIKEKLNKYDKVLFYEDSKEKLKEYSNILNKLGIDNIVIHSDNKEEEETKENYKGIIDNGHLIKAVTFTTSLINAGVNIKDNNIALIVKQDKNKCDLQKVEQFLARVRTKGNDLTLLLSSTDKEISNKIVSYDKFLNKVFKEAEIISYSFNIDVLEGYGIALNHEQFKDLWKSYKNNEVYEPVKKLLYVNDTILKADKIAVYEKARLDFERANYFNDNFIIEQLKGVKAKEIKVTYIAPLEVEKQEKEKEVKNKTLGQAIKYLLDKGVPVHELYKLVIKEIKGQDIETEDLKEFYNEYNQNKLFKEMLKNMRNNILPYLNNDLVSKVNIFTKMLLIYSDDIKKKERDLLISNIRRTEILNKTLPLGSNDAQIRLTGDYVYIAVRKNFDCYINNRKSIKNRAYDWAINDLLDFRGLKALDDKHFVNKDNKKVKVKDIVEEINNCVNSIYEISNKNYITGLK